MSNLLFKFKLQMSLLIYTEKCILKTSKTAFLFQQILEFRFFQSWAYVYM